MGKTKAEANDFWKGQGEKVFTPKGKSFFSSENFVFQALEHKFQALEHMFQALEHKFQALVYKKVLEAKSFCPGGKRKGRPVVLIGKAPKRFLIHKMSQC